MNFGEVRELARYLQLSPIGLLPEIQFLGFSREYNISNESHQYNLEIRDCFQEQKFP
jgi:hypothetical protein